MIKNILNLFRNTASEKKLANPTYMVGFADKSVYMENLFCQQACPLHVPGGRYVSAIARGEYARAMEIIRERLPFPSICGYVCHHPCETECRRNEYDIPVSIRNLKRFVADYEAEKGREPEIKIEQERQDKVAVIGGGPAGLSCAFWLRHLGYQVTVFESQPKIGGVPRSVIPEYRLSKEIVDRDVNFILKTGVEIKENTPIGTELTIESLKEQGYKAVFLAVGAPLSRKINIPGVDLDGVLWGVDFLRDVKEGKEVEIKDRVIVIGGGNVAVDVAITACSLGAKEVEMACLEKRDEMPAHSWEIEDAVKAGVVINPSWGPHRIIGEEGHVSGIEFIRCTSVFDGKGMFNPVYDESEKSVKETDMVILAIGQAYDLSVLGDKKDEYLKDGRFFVNMDTLETGVPSVFAGGDLVRIASVVDASASSKRAVLSIHRLLNPDDAKKEKDIIYTKKFNSKQLSHKAYKKRVKDFNIKKQPEAPLEEAEAVEEAKRCMECFINPIFDSDKCILCGGCVDVCPANCLKFVKIDRMLGDKKLNELIKFRYGKKLMDNELDPLKRAAIIKDEEHCLHCGLCEARCPTGAITMEFFSDEPINVS
ncbi:MAG: FAD-dependent oxidoreductase [Thermodesulfobacteriota bacterium]|nr:FAD-dependent oxidoreductase [Thermodesulfobacteriota bacterium]